MIENVVSLGIGIIVFAIVVGVGVVVLSRFGGAISNCESNYSLDGISGNETEWNDTTQNCQYLENGATQNGSGYTPEGDGYTAVSYLNTELGSSGLAGWAPAIIAFAVGMLFIGGIMVLKGRRNY